MVPIDFYFEDIQIPNTNQLISILKIFKAPKKAVLFGCHICMWVLVFYTRPRFHWRGKKMSAFRNHNLLFVWAQVMVEGGSKKGQKLFYVEYEWPLFERKVKKILFCSTYFLSIFMTNNLKTALSSHLSHDESHICREGGTSFF